MKIMCIGLDLSKNVFEVFAVDSQDKTLLRKTLKGPCIVGMESCGGTLLGRIMGSYHSVTACSPLHKGDKNDRIAVCTH